MKYKFIIIGASVIAVFALSFNITNYIVNSNASDKNVSYSQVQAQPVYLYYIGDYKGNLAVFRANDKTPMKIYDIYTSSLPKKDYDMVIHKIGVKSEAELQLLIDEYTS